MSDGRFELGRDSASETVFDFSREVDRTLADITRSSQLTQDGR